MGNHERLTGDPTGHFAPLFDTSSFGAQPAKSAWAPPTGATAVVDYPPSDALPVLEPTAVVGLRRWTFVAMVTAVWIAAAAIGAGLFYWWFHDMTDHKTWPVFTLLVYLVCCTVGALMAAMVQSRPVLSGLSLAVMSAPLASMLGAAGLYGGYVFDWIAR
jgi:hypothetical protein